MLAQKPTGEFYTYTSLNVLDVNANHLSQPLMGDESSDLEGFINRSFQKCRGDHFQLIQMVSKREKMLKALSGSDSDIWTESYRTMGQPEMIIVKTLKWTGKRFVEVI